MFIEWKTATDGTRYKRFNKYIADCVILKEIDVRAEGEGAGRKFFWRTHKPDLFD